MKTENIQPGGPVRFVLRAFNVPKIQELTEKMRQLRNGGGEQNIYGEIDRRLNGLRADYLVNDARNAWIALTVAEIAGVVALPFAIYMSWPK